MTRPTFKIVVLLMAVALCNVATASNENEGLSTGQLTEEVRNNSLFCAPHDFSSPADQGRILLRHFEELKNAVGKAKQALETQFFCAFPNNFTQMQQIFGFQNGTQAPLYDVPTSAERYIQNDIYNDVIGYFSELQSVPKDVYYKKYIKVCVNGEWEADNISQGFGLWNRILMDSESVSKALNMYSNEEIKSVFRFFFDGPHPNNDYNKNLYSKLSSALKKSNLRLTDLLTESYSKIVDGGGSTVVERESTVTQLDYPYTVLDNWLQLGMPEEGIISKLGTPLEKGNEVAWEAVGLFVQEWKYPAKGITLHMASDQAGKPKQVEMITISEPCKMKTTSNIGLGASRKQVLEAYHDKLARHEGDDQSKAIIAGSLYGGIIFSMEEDEVTQVFIGAAAE